MITSKITSIVLEDERIRVFLELSNGTLENNLFSPESTAMDMVRWKQNREDYYNNLQLKVDDLVNALVNTEYTPWDFNTLPLRISMSFRDWTSLISDYPEMAGLVTAFKETMVDHGMRKYIYLTELYPEHEAILGEYKSFLKEPITIIG